MSLKDTIEGARREAEGNAVRSPKKEAESVGLDEKKGFVRSSAAKARPVREAGSSVRVVSSSASRDAFGNKKETKEEKKERKRRERDERDLRNRAYDLVLRGIPGYRKTEKVFWVFLGAGMVLAVLSLVFANLFDGSTDVSTWQGLLSVISLVLAYAFIIASFIYDLVKRRRFRKEAEARVSSMTQKRVEQLLEKARVAELAQAAKEADEKAEREAAKKKRKRAGE